MTTLMTFVSIFNLIRKVCSDIPSFGISTAWWLVPFSYLKQPMVRDCENIDALVASDLVAALAGDADAITAVKSQAGDIREADPDYQPVEAEHLILDADASQSFVVNAALAGRNLVVQGPPGTGKSQTIANVIACLVAEGKTVLFVAQKRPQLRPCSIVSTPPDWAISPLTFSLLEPHDAMWPSRFETYSTDNQQSGTRSRVACTSL